MADEAKDLIAEFEERAKYMDRRNDKGFVNEKTGSSLGIKKNGDIVIASSPHAQIKLNHDKGIVTEVALQSNTVAVKKNIKTDELIINDHKLNQQLVELSDMRDIDDKRVMGNLTMLGTVLVKAWDVNLQKYVLIRRLVRIPMFSHALNMPDTPEALGLDTDIAQEKQNLNPQKKE